MKHMPLYRLTLVASLLLLLFGCSTADNSEPPAVLTEIENPERVRELWSFQIGKSSSVNLFDLAPLALGDVIYTIDLQGVIHQVDAKYGKKNWSFDSDLPAIAGLSGDAEHLVATSRDGEVALYEVKQESLELRWKKQLSSEIRTQAVLDDGQVFVRTGGGKLSALDAASGEIQWTVTRRVPALSLTGNSRPIPIGDLVISGFDNGKLVAFERSNGATAWETTIGSPRGRTEIERLVDLDGQFVVRDGVIYVSSFQGNLAAVTANTGQVIWSREFSSSKAIAADQEALYLVDDRSHLWSVDRRTGSSFWKQDVLNARKITAPAIIGERIIVGDLAGYLHILRRSDGQLMARKRPFEQRYISQPANNQDTVIALDVGGNLTAIRPEPAQ
jgi:outer membrane protein assembly factor BamB